MKKVVAPAEMVYVVGRLVMISLIFGSLNSTVAHTCLKFVSQDG